MAALKHIEMQYVGDLCVFSVLGMDTFPNIWTLHICFHCVDWVHVATTALQVALDLAEQISSFPQQCLRADRASAMYGCYDAPSFTQVGRSIFTHFDGIIA